jgi:hypothetical protein
VLGPVIDFAGAGSYDAQAVGETIVDKATGTILQRTAGVADGSFTQVVTLESLHTLPLNHATKKLLAMQRPYGARTDRQTDSQRSY